MHVQNQLFEHRADLRATYLHAFGRTVFEKEVRVEGLIVSARSAGQRRAVAERDRRVWRTSQLCPQCLTRTSER